MKTLKPLRTEADYEAALEELERRLEGGERGREARDAARGDEHHQHAGRGQRHELHTVERRGLMSRTQREADVPGGLVEKLMEKEAK